MLLPGSAHPDLGRAVSEALGTHPGAITVRRFPDGEVSVRIDEPVRRRPVFVVQPTPPPVDPHLMELLAIGDACRRGGADRLVAVVPYFGYARADRTHGGCEPVTASLVARLIEEAGFQQVVAVDPHSAALEGFFRVPLVNLSAVDLLADAFGEDLEPATVVVSPDLGRVGMATTLGQRLGLEVAVVHKRRTGPRMVEAVQVIGDVRDRPCLVVDDMISTGGTLVESARALAHAGARVPPLVAATHGLLVEDAMEALAGAGIEEVVVTDTVPRADAASDPGRDASSSASRPRLRVLSVADLLAEALAPFG